MDLLMALCRGGKMKNAKGKGKKGAKGKKEMYDLIVNIDLAEWRLTIEQAGLRNLNYNPTQKIYNWTLCKSTCWIYLINSKSSYIGLTSSSGHLKL